MFPVLFGTVSGFQHLVLGKPPIAFDERWIDFRNELALEDREEALVVSRRREAGAVLTWVGHYRFANEKTMRRGGQFGVGFWLLDERAPGEQIVPLLRVLVDEVERCGVLGSQFVKELDEISQSINWHRDLGVRLSESLEPYECGGLGWGDLPTGMFATGGDAGSAALAEWVDWAQVGTGLDSYKRLICTSSARLARRVLANSLVTELSPTKLLVAAVKDRRDLAKAADAAYAQRDSAIREKNEVTAAAQLEQKRRDEFWRSESEKQKAQSDATLRREKEANLTERARIEQASNAALRERERTIRAELSSGIEHRIDELASQLADARAKIADLGRDIKDANTRADVLAAQINTLSQQRSKSPEVTQWPLQQVPDVLRGGNAHGHGDVAGWARSATKRSPPPHYVEPPKRNWWTKWNFFKLICGIVFVAILLQCTDSKKATESVVPAPPALSGSGPANVAPVPRYWPPGTSSNAPRLDPLPRPLLDDSSRQKWPW